MNNITKTILGILLAVIFMGYGPENACIQDQIDHVDSLKQSYESGEAVKVNEQDFCAFDLSNDDEIKFNEIQMLASHNSFKLEQPKFSNTLSHLLFPFASEDPEVMNYSHKNLTEQLNMGIRSMEWDIIKYDGEFDGYMIQHESFIDPRSSIPNLELALEELLMWSNYNENHMPIIIQIEGKHPTLPDLRKTEITNADVMEIGELLQKVLGDKLVTPSQMMSGYDNFAQMRDDDFFPSLADMRGKIMFAIQPWTNSNYFMSEYPIEDQKLFFMTSGANSCITYFNDVDIQFDEVKDHNDLGFLTRVIGGSWQQEDRETRMQIAIDSGASIISSDYIYEDVYGENTLKLNEDGYTIQLKK